MEYKPSATYAQLFIDCGKLQFKYRIIIVSNDDEVKSWHAYLCKTSNLFIFIDTSVVYFSTKLAIG